MPYTLWFICICREARRPLVKVLLLETSIMAIELIGSDPHIMMGKPVIQGTRITVESLLEKLAAGETVEQILEAHPRLTPESIKAALSFAAQSIRADVVYPVSVD